MHSPTALTSAQVDAFDGYGNLAALLKADGSRLTAQYEYGPFGEVLRATGPLAKANPFRFSTKYQDNETDLLYYGYRYYNSSTGRWLSQDPIGERGGINLYGFVLNEPLCFIDSNGLTTFRGRGEGGGPEMPILPLRPDSFPIANAAWLSFRDRIGLMPKLNETSAFQTDPRLSEATDAAVNYFRQQVNKQLCASPTANVDVSKLVFTVNPESQGGAPRISFPMQMSNWESSSVIGWYEYRLAFLRFERFGDRVDWRANIVVIDKLGWDVEKYGATFQGFICYMKGGGFYDSDYFPSSNPALRQIPDRAMQEARELAALPNGLTVGVFGGVREFERARWTIFGEVCCGTRK